MLTSLALVAALTAQQNTAYASTSPIQVAACDASVASTTAAGFPGISVPAASSVSIAFVNQNQKTVKSVTFNVNGASVVDAGTFSPGVTIKHEFVSPQLLGDSDATCSVQSVAFADGSVWQAQ
jgi:hypothetical protein